MTALSAIAGACLAAVAIVTPLSLLWIPGAVLLGWALHRHRTRHERWARRRRGARAGWIR